MKARLCATLLVFAWLLPESLPAQSMEEFIRQHYSRSDHTIPMRDGVKLYTIVYAPRDTSQNYPLLMTRTPYGSGPYDKGQVRSQLGPSDLFVKEGYIFVYQDVRGRYMSEGEFKNMRPQQTSHATRFDIDESTDTYDTIDWLVRHVANHNGKVGLWGISYPGFYSSAGMINAHPHLKAVSPQAPIADWFFDDFFHHGAFFLPHAFNFFANFGQPRPQPTTQGVKRFQHGTPDGYQFFLDLGSLRNVNPRYFKNNIAFWNTITEHPNYDKFWQARNILPHLKKVAPAVMTVGGWFDAEDLYGPLKTYQVIEKQNPGIRNILVMGPWRHGGWHRSPGDRLGNIHFGGKTAEQYQRQMELPFFNFHLKGKGQPDLAEANMFETGTNRWRSFSAWPPQHVAKQNLYLHQGGTLSFEAPTEKEPAYEEYISDPQRPVPFTEDIANHMTVEYMTDDQRYAARRPDVLVCQTAPLKENLTLAGPMLAKLIVSTSGTDADWIVKVIDVFPQDAQNFPGVTMKRPLAGYQMLVRSEVIRGRFRNSYSKPEPFVPNEPTPVNLELQDVLHTFQKGHRIMVQISSTWFPLVDRNPQKYVPNIFRADDEDFIRATQRVYCNPQHPTHLEIGVLPRK